MYGKVFDSIYDGTLYGHWEAIVTMQQLVVLCTPDGIVDMTPEAIAARTSIPLKIIAKGLKILAEPDPHSRTPGEDGRRIVPMDDHRPWGWVLVNHGKYQHMQDADTVRAQTRERVRKHREKEALKRTVTDGNGQKRHSDSDSDSKTTTDASASPFEEFWKAYPKRAGNNPKTRAARCYRARLAEKHSPAEILKGVARYAKFCAVTGKTGTELVLQAATFLGPDKGFLQDWAAANENGEWWKSEGSTVKKGQEVGVNARPGESMEEYRGRIRERLAV